ncbi:HAD-like protein [Metschnikowia bicuspidata var. bicuspidata NRRL YB-4993]|uniref:4-nitrophenylphosphatase n=1 Tax=Metschnikowia bicuspidata var. bicuspidata NRRL YB-4993 TaxID=869754 RepID=A0A1A0H5R6_9ASCO|nr:HAD-like protein [Metschnikowia bicuspidata var. bicuspidata NRRL YB-4993]OBA19376.1 HAD-like protein [Metschnikowia bicuspidata var. bicuspidata NRRL YB-4993]
MAFVTNNSSKSRNTYVRKFSDLGFEHIEKSAIYPTCYSAALVIKEQLKIPPQSKVWVFGDEGIEQELKECGYIPCGGSDPSLDSEWDPDSPILKIDQEVKAVVVGSTKKLNYMRLATTVQYLLVDEKSIPFIGANIDTTYPGPKGMILPAGGPMVNLMSYTCGRDFINVGKPSGLLLNTILQDQKFDRERTLMVGDTMYTDIKFGNDGKLGGKNGGTLLVLSGGSKLGDLKNIEDKSTEPQYYIESLGHLFDLLK